MSIVKEINELNFILKFVILNVCLTSTFFYIDMYFLTNEIFNKAPVYIPIVTALCMSICWYYSSMIVIVLFDKSSSKKNENEMHNIHTNFTLISVISISIISAFSIYFRLTFRNFFHTCLIAVAFFFLLGVLLTNKNKETPK